MSDMVRLATHIQEDVFKPASKAEQAERYRKFKGNLTDDSISKIRKMLAARDASLTQEANEWNDLEWIYYNGVRGWKYVPEANVIDTFIDILEGLGVEIDLSNLEKYAQEMIKQYEKDPYSLA